MTGFESARSYLWFEGCGLGANCGDRGQRPQLQWRRRRLAGGFLSLGALTSEPMWASARFEDFSLQRLEWRGGEVVLKSGRRDVGVPGVGRESGGVV